MYTYPDTTTVNDRLAAQESIAKVVDVLASHYIQPKKVRLMLDLLRQIHKEAEDTGLRSALLKLNSKLYDGAIKIRRVDFASLVIVEQAVSLVAGFTTQGTSIDDAVVEFINSPEPWEFVLEYRGILEQLAKVLRERDLK